MFWNKNKKGVNGGIEFVIAGLGNPGSEYENTRHNAGFITIDILAEKTGLRVNRQKHRALVGTGIIAGHKVMLVKPQTYMNLSGESIRQVLDYYKVPVERLVVIYDDIDLPAGDIRIRKKGSAGTHNGMKSIVSKIGSGDFPRIRIGIGDNRKGNLAEYVIGNMSKEEERNLKPVFEKCADAAVSIVRDGTDIAMNRYNTKNKKNGDA